MELQRQIEILGAQVFADMKGEKPGMFNRDYWQGRMMDWVMQDPSFKVDMFRFVDVLPQLNSSDQVATHIREYLLKEGRELPTLIGAALKAAAGGLTSGIAAKAIRKNVTDMAERFIVGQDAQSARGILWELHKQGIAFTVDLLGESTLSNHEADAYQRRYLDLIVHLAKETASWPEDRVIDSNHLGKIPRANVSIKITAMDPQLRALDPKGAVDRLKKRILPLFLAAKENNVFLNVDLETWEMHGITYDLFEEILSHPELKSWPHVGIVVQAYLTHAVRDVERLLSLAKRRQAPLTVRLVKGAYWDYEVVIAKQRGHECPVFTQKAASDANYERLSQMLLNNVDHLNPAFGSHNLRSLLHAMVYAKEKGLPLLSYEVQMLYGMAEPERRVMRSMGNRVRVYAPVGELLPGMAYLVRRLLENTSNSGFLRMSHHDKGDVKNLLSAPTPKPNAEGGENPGLEFSNCPLLDFTRSELRTQFAASVEKVRARLPVQVPIVVEGASKAAAETLSHVCPSDSALETTRINCASVADCDQAVDVAFRAYPAWRDRPLEERAALLDKLADRLEKDRIELAALQTLEVAKPWAEADADVAEAIDFCRYYAMQARSDLSGHDQGNVWGESNRLIYEGRGPSVVIAPWNFPLAILCGMASAALVAGNPVLLKPAEQSSAVAYSLFERMLAVGFPKEVVHFLPGRGEVIGAYLVDHLKIAQIAFTGSKQVGLEIIERAAKTRPGQPQVKRVVCEMGGKNAIIIDDDADLDEAVLGVIHSAFGFAGQKCSACSRVIVHASIYDAYVQRLIEACKGLIIGPAHYPSCGLGPVIDETAHKRLMREIDRAKESARPLYIGESYAGGHFVPPALFEVKEASHFLMQEELFGPVIALIKANDFSDAIRIANSTPFALTGAAYSRSPSHLEQARKQFRVGNLYLNRPSTGALVHRQPFGGFGMSGIGTKAGGPGYLMHFVDPRCVTENTMRRGFTPELDT